MHLSKRGMVSEYIIVAFVFLFLLASCSESNSDLNYETEAEVEILVKTGITTLFKDPEEARPYFTEEYFQQILDDAREGGANFESFEEVEVTILKTDSIDENTTVVMYHLTQKEKATGETWDRYMNAWTTRQADGSWKISGD